MYQTETSHNIMHLKILNKIIFRVTLACDTCTGSILGTLLIVFPDSQVTFGQLHFAPQRGQILQKAFEVRLKCENLNICAITWKSQKFTLTEEVNSCAVSSDEEMF